MLQPSPRASKSNIYTRELWYYINFFLESDLHTISSALASMFAAINCFYFSIPQLCIFVSIRGLQPRSFGDSDDDHDETGEWIIWVEFWISQRARRNSIWIFSQIHFSLSTLRLSKDIESEFFLILLALLCPIASLTLALSRVGEFRAHSSCGLVLYSEFNSDKL